MYFFFLFPPQISTKQGFFYVVLWVDASEPIVFDIKYPYIYLFDISCDTWI